MPKSENQKLKLLILKDIFENETDEAHPLTVPQLIEKLHAEGIKAERKSIYDDLRTLQDYGLDIVSVKSKTYGYYLGSRSFELAELKLLVDAVQSCRFLSAKKSTQLIKKIERLASVHDAQDLHRQVYVAHRVKTMNESVYYAIDAIHSAISKNRQITFYYFQWTPTKQTELRHDGRQYCVSPYALIWEDESYYLVAWDDAAAMLKHYRVDKMERLAVAETPRTGGEACAKLDIAAYAQTKMGMYGGEEESVRLRVENRFANVIFDRFGKELTVTNANETSFEISVRIVPSPLFYGWVAGVGGAVQIMAPAAVRSAFAALCRSAQKAHTP